MCWPKSYQLLINSEWEFPNGSTTFGIITYLEDHIISLSYIDENERCEDEAPVSWPPEVTISPRYTSGQIRMEVLSVFDKYWKRERIPLFLLVIIYYDRFYANYIFHYFLWKFTSLKNIIRFLMLSLLLY